MSKAKTLKVLDTINVPVPCSQSWEQMSGSEARRFCELCSHSVVNLSALSKESAADLLQNRGTGRLCVRYALDQQGQIQFKPKISRSLKMWQTSAMIFGAIFTLLGLTPTISAQNQPTARPETTINGHTIGMIAPPEATPVAQPQRLGEMVAPQVTPLAQPTSQSSNQDPRREMLGKIAPSK